MQNKTGLFTAGKDVDEAFGKLLKAANPGYVEVEVDMAKSKMKVKSSVFELEEKDNGGLFKAIREVCVEKTHQLFIVKDPNSDKTQYKILHFGSDGSNVKTRMIYASAKDPLKTHLGSNKFVEDYFFNTIAECSQAGMLDAGVDVADMYTEEEVIKQQILDEEDVKMARSAVMKPLPVKVKDDATRTLIADYAAGKARALELTLDGKQKLSAKKIEIEEKASCEDTIKVVFGAIKDKEIPRYIIFTYPHAKKVSQVFLYYCPENAERTMKFTYSTCKGVITTALEAAGIVIDGKMEEAPRADEDPDVTVDSVNLTLYPPTSVKKTFAKPAVGRKRRAPKRRAAKKKKTAE